MSASETTPTILPFLPATGAPLIWFLISIIANFFTVVVELTVMTSLVIMSLASIGHTSKSFPASVVNQLQKARHYFGHFAFNSPAERALRDRGCGIITKIARSQEPMTIVRYSVVFYSRGAHTFSAQYRQWKRIISRGRAVELPVDEM
jgi:hypothetical protein